MIEEFSNVFLWRRWILCLYTQRPRDKGVFYFGNGKGNRICQYVQYALKI